MRKNKEYFAFFICAIAIYLSGVYAGIVSERDNGKKIYDTVIIKVKEGNDSVKWDKLINAIIQVESERKDSAKSNKGAVGQLQLMPVYVKDANRILGEEKYSLSDRYKRDTSIEMFNVVQGHYNPTHDIAKAIKLHNPKAGKWYYNRVMEQLKNQEI